ncbi:hypothetical protein BB558_004625 [Smittium angustum]|uniref:Uncharacterized protein n=1 Tax=Smittium angustum TaxID=133377 RepID=A0A2U1J2P7_SMIAN|nr:hypothetical protein BB558_004625 [Smittium angustum]
MTILWPQGNPYGWYPLILSTIGTGFLCIIIDPDSRILLKHFLLHIINIHHLPLGKHSRLKLDTPKDPINNIRVPLEIKKPITIHLPEQTDKKPINTRQKSVEISKNNSKDIPKMISKTKSRVTIQFIEETNDAALLLKLKKLANPKRRHMIYVCTKCQRQESKCGYGYYCRLEPNSNADIGDIEDLISPLVAMQSEDGKRKKSGRVLYEGLSSLLKQQERIKKLSTRSGVARKNRPSISGNRSSEKIGFGCENSIEPFIQIVPVDCLGTCSRGNVIAFSSENKYSYQFGDINEVDEEDLSSILEFASTYMESEDGFTKTKTRPSKLKNNLLSRIPPLSNNFRNLAQP